MIKSTVMLCRPTPVTLSHAIKTHYVDFEELFVSIGQLAYKYLFESNTQTINYVAFNFGYTIKAPAPLTSETPNREWYRNVGFCLLNCYTYCNAVRIEVKEEEGVGFNVLSHTVPTSSLDLSPCFYDMGYRKGV
jgi:hypothetical protein